MARGVAIDDYSLLPSSFLSLSFSLNKFLKNSVVKFENARTEVQMKWERKHGKAPASPT
jgi:hypothetical protein